MNKKLSIMAVMSVCVATIVAESKAMTRQEYNDLRGWQLPDDENGNDDGYRVVNTETKSQSWVTKEVYETSYKSVNDGVNFGSAIELLKQDYRVQRKGWNGKNMWIILVRADEYKIEPYKYFGADGHEDMIMMKTADNKLIPWLCSQADMLVEDWVLI